MTEEEYLDLLDYLEDQSQKAFEGARDRSIDPDLRQRWAGAHWAFEIALDRLMNKEKV